MEYVGYGVLVIIFAVTLIANTRIMLPSTVQVGVVTFFEFGYMWSDNTTFINNVRLARGRVEDGMALGKYTVFFVRPKWISRML